VPVADRGTASDEPPGEVTLEIRLHSTGDRLG